MKAIVFDKRNSLLSPPCPWGSLQECRNRDGGCALSTFSYSDNFISLSVNSPELSQTFPIQKERKTSQQPDLDDNSYWCWQHSALSERLCFSFSNHQLCILFLPRICTPVPYLDGGAVGKLRFLTALGSHGGVAGADEHGGADLQCLPLRRVDHAVESVEGGGDGELPQALPPGVGHLGECWRIRALGFGRRRS